jgi:chromosome partitioning protein
MARKVDVDDLVGAAEIAERLGLAHRETVHNWRRRYPDFPAPIAELRQGLLWSWPDVERWARQRHGART